LTALGDTAAAICAQTGNEKGGQATDDKTKDGKDAHPDWKKRASAGKSPVALGDDPVRVTLEPVPERDGEKAIGMRQRVSALAPEGRLYLVVRGLKADLPPGVLYNVYLDLPDHAPRDARKRHAVGVFNFFDAAGKEPKDTTKTKDDRFLSFDVTRRARFLHSQGLLRDKPVLTIIPSGKPADDAKATVGEILLIER
jgi:tyrosinase